MAWDENLPQWENEGVEPPAQKKTDGWQISEKPPAGWFNWLFNRAYKCIVEIRNIFDAHTHNGTNSPKIDYNDLNNKPTSMTPTAHKSTHASGGSDALTPADIGAIANSAGSVTDSNIGNRTADQTQAPSGSTGTITQLFSWLANRIKAITGKTNWWDAPSKTLEDLNTHFSDYVRQPGFATATGSANTYAVTLSPAPTAYTDGMAVAVKINVDNTGASTINVNGLGAKSIKKLNGTDVVAGNLKSGSIYSLRYNGTNFILQGEGGGGTAVPADVLTGKTFTSDSGPDKTGTMPNNGAVVITPSTANQAIAAGYHNGSGYVVGDANLVAGNIANGISIFGVVGSQTSGIVSAGSAYTYLQALTSRTVSVGTSTILKSFTVGNIKGTIRISFTYNAGSNLNAYAQIYKNGSPVGMLRTVANGAGSVTFTEDFSVSPNDVFDIRCYVQNPGNNATLSNAKITTNENTTISVTD